ncbi:hypothetical protein B0T39_23505 [Chromobacterium haemolyticum]|nr:hypothetical protein B0T39_23505 [Chromobacterium haemolyticum]
MSNTIHIAVLSHEASHVEARSADSYESLNERLSHEFPAGFTLEVSSNEGLIKWFRGDAGDGDEIILYRLTAKAAAN